ncbi:DUF6639 family protein [Antarctobacter jejuensis]|uniref:DUF6639 family protein n=1 Tax=Antarctobacter jejuensis TaxID=1439938 RepID=UPI003FD24662
MIVRASLTLILMAGQLGAQCSNGVIDIAPASKAYRDRICSVTDGFLPVLSACGLRLSRSVTVEAVPEMAPDVAHCLGAYRCEQERIEVLDPDVLKTNTLAVELYGGLSGADLFAGILTHELTHAAIEHTIGDREITHSGHEYIAYAMQIAGMQASHRATFFAGRDMPTQVDIGYFNPFILMAAPEKFAALAYVHFSHPENGCGFIASVLSGEIVLGDPANDL